MVSFRLRTETGSPDAARATSAPRASSRAPVIAFNEAVSISA
jgi:hypothetical protein